VGSAIFLGGALATACRPTPTPETADASRAASVDRPESDEHSVLDLPDAIPGFASEPRTHESAFDRRAYVRGGAQVTVTLARVPMSPSGYLDWVRQSEESYPQASLGLLPERANGFYQCDDVDGASACNLLIQMRSGVHLEVRGSHGAMRGDLDAVVRGLPLRRLASETAGAPPNASDTVARPDTDAADRVSFARDVLPVLVRECSTAAGCHGEQASHHTDLDLRPASAYRTLVGRASRERLAAQLVEPGHPARSFLVDKLTLERLPKGEGEPMPLDTDTGLPRGDSPLDPWAWEVLVPWIAQGATNN
jgi:hypothetical protein